MMQVAIVTGMHAGSGFALAAPMHHVLVRTLATHMRLARVSEHTRAATK